MILPLPLYLFIFIELFFVSVGDIRERKIPNLWAILNIILYIFFLFFFSDIYTLNFEGLLYPLVFLFVGFALFVFRVMGGGDAKYLASLFLIIPLHFHDLLFRYLLLTTILIGIAFLINSMWIHRVKLIESFKQKDIKGIKECFGTKFAYAPVVLISWVYIGWDLRNVYF